MAASNQDVLGWIEQAREQGATHIISVCDTFSWDDYPVFIMPGDDLEKKIKHFKNADMQTVNEVIEIE